MKKDVRHPLPRTPLQALRLHAWNVLDKPSSSRLAKVTHMPSYRVAKVTHLPSSRLAKVTHLSSSRLDKVTHLPSSRLAKVTHLSSSRLAKVTHLPSSRLAKVTHMSSSRLAKVAHLSSSCLAKAYFLLFLVFLSLSLFSMIVSTHPTFLRDMDLDEWKEALGDRYKDHYNFLRKQMGLHPQPLTPPPPPKIRKRSVDQRYIPAPRNLDIQLQRSSRPKRYPIRNGVPGAEELLEGNPQIDGYDRDRRVPDTKTAGDGIKTFSQDSRYQESVAGTSEGTAAATVIHHDQPQKYYQSLPDRNTDIKITTSVRQQKNKLTDARHDSIASDDVDRGPREHTTDVSRDVVDTAEEMPTERSPHGTPKPDQNKNVEIDLPRVRRAAPAVNMPHTEAPVADNETNGTNVTSNDVDDDLHDYDRFRARLDFLDYLDYTCLIFFTVDFILRVLSCPKLTAFARNFLNISDFIALLAGYAMVLVEKLLPEEKYSLSHLDLLECLQIFRFVRFFRPLRDVIGFKVLVHSVKASTYELLLLVMFLSAGVVVFSTVLYWCERANMASIPDAFWWAIVTMTTVGYGDMTPVTFQGKVVGSLCALSGVVLIAITIPVLVNNFLLFYGYAKVIVARQAEAREREVKHKWQQAAQEMLGRPGSGVNRVNVQPAPDAMVDSWSKDAAKAKVTSPHCKDNTPPPRQF
ncbi:hypothetical protein ACOMHN_040650 [Nucella lapillus]